MFLFFIFIKYTISLRVLRVGSFYARDCVWQPVLYTVVVPSLFLFLSLSLSLHYHSKHERRSWFCFFFVFEVGSLRTARSSGSTCRGRAPCPPRRRPPRPPSRPPPPPPPRSPPPTCSRAARRPHLVRRLSLLF